MNRERLAARAAAALALWLGFWVLAFSLVAALAWIPIASLRYRGEPGLGGFAAGALALTLLWSLRPRGWFKRSEAPPPALPRARYPALYDFVEEAARHVGVRPPDALQLAGGATAFAAEHRRWFGLRRTRRIGLGLPLVAFLSRDELGAVLCHELGHYARGDLGLGPWVHHTHRAIGTTIAELEDSAFWLDLPFRAYGQLFLRVSRSVSRAQEHAADALAARAWGAAALGGALEKLERMEPHWSIYLSHEVLPLLASGVAVPLLEGFARFLRAEKKRPEIQAELDRAASVPPSRWDTHPSTPERLAALGCVTATCALVPAGCLELLGGAQAAEATLYAAWSGAAPKALEWERLWPEVLLPTWRKSLAEKQAPLGVPLERLPELLAEDSPWAQRHDGSFDLLSPEAKRRRVRMLLGRWFACALADRGFEGAVEPGAPVVLRRDDVEIDPLEWVERLARGELARDAFIAWARELEQTSTPAAGRAR